LHVTLEVFTKLFRIMEQVADWEVGTGRTDQESTWTKTKQMVVTLPDGKTRTIGITQVNSQNVFEVRESVWSSWLLARFPSQRPGFDSRLG